MAKSFRTKKSLGQNFLRSESALKKIVAAANVSPGDTVLEIGPGEGALTKKLLAVSQKVIAVEKDVRLISVLEEKFKKEISTGKLSLTYGDALKFDPAVHELHSGKFVIVSNIPYYITGAFLKKFLGGNVLPKKITLLIQKEVAQRIVARDGKESILSISVKAYGEPKIFSYVPRGAFAPAPKVDSAILTVEKISKKNFKEISENKFFEIVRAGFAHKRKKLSGNLKKVFREAAVDKMNAAKIKDGARAENLSLDDWMRLAS